MQDRKGHRKHDRQFKEEAVRLVTEGENRQRGLPLRDNGVCP